MNFQILQPAGRALHFGSLGLCSPSKSARPSSNEALSEILSLRQNCQALRQYVMVTSVSSPTHFGFGPARQDVGCQSADSCTHVKLHQRMCTTTSAHLNGIILILEGFGTSIVCRLRARKSQQAYRAEGPHVAHICGQEAPFTRTGAGRSIATKRLARQSSLSISSKA